MNDPGFPGQHTTTTTVTETKAVTTLRFDPSYVKILPGWMKIICIALDLLGFICIEVSGFAWVSRGSYFNTVAMIGFWFTGFLLAFYLFHVCEKFYRVPWLHIEMFFNAIWAVLYLIAACLAATFRVEAYSAAAFFGFCAMCAYGFDAFLKFKDVRAGAIAQGTRVQSATVSPA
uniref:Putative chemokine-like factor superfamily 4 n=1 Tax=Tabanus bromius TaxID=304241 RepID=A0A0K8TT38_TABBR